MSSIFLALIILSHNILALMFFFFSLSYIVFLICLEKNKKPLIQNTLYIILLGLGLSAIFWLPAIYEAKYVTGLRIFDVSSHFPDLYQLLIPSWGSGFSGAGMQNEMSYQIGAANLLAVFLSSIVIILQIRERSKNLPYMFFSLVCFIFVLILMLRVSLPIWQTIPFMNYFQFPWRLLSIEIIFTSFLAGSVFSLNIKNNLLKIFIAAMLIFITFILGIGYTKPAYYMYRDDNYYINKSNFIDGTNSPGNVFNTIYLKSIPSKEKERLVFIKGNGKIILDKAKSNLYEFSIQADANSEIQANIAYFPGWEVYVNSKKEPLRSIRSGRLIFTVPGGKNKVEIVFRNTFVRNISSIASIISLGFLAALLISKRFVTIKK
jgi:hypothetical protein